MLASQIFLPISAIVANGGEVLEGLRDSDFTLIGS